MKCSAILRIFGAAVLILLLGRPLAPVSAHTGFKAGPYTLEIGWMSEPPVAGQPNGIVVLLSAGEHAESSATTPAAEKPVAIDPSGLALRMTYGNQTKTLALQPQSEDTPLELVARLTPSLKGRYTVEITGKLTGDLGPADVSIRAQPEEVVGVERVQFPSLSDPQAGSPVDWLPLVALAAGILGIVLGVIALVKK